MLVQKGKLPDSNRFVWIVLDDDYLPVEPIQKYIYYLDSLDKSPNTIRTYAHNLKLFWEFLKDKQLDWREISLERLSDFIHWLRNPDPSVIPIQSRVSQRTEKTINHALTTVCSFYEFQERLGTTEGVDAYRYQMQPGRKYKSFLHGISKSKEIKTRLLKVKEPKTFPGCLTSEEISQVVNACNRIRDKFLVCLLYETGMRIGETLGLRHEDIHSQGVNEIHVIPREDNVNSSRVKSGVQRIIHVTKELLNLYSSYLIDEYPEDIDCDYVFVNCWDGEIGKPMDYKAVIGLFRRLSKKTGIKISPHLLRHTHATELIRAGWDMSHVQKRLGHSSIQTTINTYVHLTDEDLQKEYYKYLEKRKENAT